jgi:phosphoribosylaminoimidazole-succinocarboxamide synthase
MKKLDIYREGKTKIVYNTEEEDKAIIKYKDDITAFNGAKKDKLEEKGRINNKIATKIFNYLENKGNIRTHFIYLLDDEHVLVEKTEMIPIEITVRNKAAGGLLKKAEYVQEGDELATPILEFHIKDDEQRDPEVEPEYLVEKGILDENEVENIKRVSLKVNNLLKLYFEEINLDIIDFKLEFGRKGNEILLADEITPDTCRLWDMSTGEKYDKDIFREELGDVMAGYEEVLRRMESKK